MMSVPFIFQKSVIGKLRSIGCGFFFLFLGSSLPAAVVTTPAISVSGSLSRDRVPAGEMVELNIKVTGAQEADLPKDLAVKGLQIRLSGQSSQVQMVNYSISSSVIYSYIVMPLDVGTFTIPAIPVRVQGKYFQTKPLQLTVLDTLNQAPSAPVASLNGMPLSSRARGGAPAVDNDNNEDQLAFGELSVAKKKIYVGEVVPAEIRFYVDARYNAEPRSDVALNEEGLLVEDLTKPKADVVDRNGRTYNMVAMKTLISAVKPGIIEMTPASLDLLVTLPMPIPPRTPDIIAEMMRRAGGSSQVKQVKAVTNKLSLEVLPLPQEGRPNGFSGAIGEFKLTATASPMKPLPGDPVTLSLKLEGKGNFKALKPPQLTDGEGWQLYPPTDRFEPNDLLGWGGVKSFATTMLAQQSLAATPGALFSYFDPNSGRYVVLTTKPITLEKPAEASPSAAPTASSVATPAAMPAASASQNEALEETSSRFWQTPFCRREFLIIWSSVLGVVLLALFYLGLKYRRQILELRHREERHFQKLWEELHDKNLEPLTFFNKAGAYAELLLKKNPSRWETVKAVLKRRDEINYGAREIRLQAAEREKILELLSLQSKEQQEKQ